MSDKHEVATPSHDELVEELKLVRRSGIVALRRLELPALGAACVASDYDQGESPVGPPAIETLLRKALAELEGGRLGEAGSLLFGLTPGTRGDRPAQLRVEAADLFNVGRSRFRNHYERIIIDQLAEQVLRRCHQHQLRLSAIQMERRLPTSSRLAVAWMDRFQAYYAMWTPIYATAASIVAYRAMLLDEERPYDRPPSEDEPDGYTQEQQAARYGSQGLYYLAEYLDELRRFRTRFGGLWILSSKAADTDLADAAYLVHYLAPFSDTEQSLLRMSYSDAAGELDTFRSFENSDQAFRKVHATWQRFLSTCQCSWPIAEAPEAGHFHTNQIAPTISEDCQPHQVVKAANDYCTIIDDEWDLIADWYHLGENRDTGVDGLTMYHQLRESAKAAGANVWPPWGSIASEERSA